MIRRKNDAEAQAKRVGKHEEDFGPLATYVRLLRCCVCKAAGRWQRTHTQAAHVLTRGAGNKAWLENGDGNIIPLCDTDHRAQHQHGWTAIFKGTPEEAKADAMLEARRVGAEFLAHDPDGWLPA